MQDVGEEAGHPRLRRTGRVLLVLVAGLLGAWAGLFLGARVDTQIGPLEVRLSLGPSLSGESVIRVPPLGSVVIDSHDSPLRLTAAIQGVNATDARAIFDNPGVLEGLEGRILVDLREGVTVLVVRGLVGAGIGGLALGLLVLRPRRLGWAASGTAVVVLVGSGAASVATVDQQSILQPRYSGLLSSAPALVGSAETIATNFADYREGLASMVSRVSRLYDVTSTLPVFEPDEDVTRVLHISDLHVNPTSWALIRSVVEQFDVDVVVDTGDIVHQGTQVENAYVDEISTVRVPYVYVRGNHDSQATKRAVEAEPNAVVLEGDVAEVAGVTFFGVGDPRFTPDKSTATLESDDVVAAGVAAAEVARASGAKIDIAIVHDPREARELDGVAPLLLAGHMHTRARELLPEGSRLFQQGSTGASGINALRNEEPTPITMTVLYLDRDSGELDAWDDITFGGLGVVSAEIERRLADSFTDDAVVPPDYEPPAVDEPEPTSPGTALVMPTGVPYAFRVPDGDGTDTG